MNNPEITQAEKRRVLANDRKVAEERRLSTYRAFAEANADLELGGRFSKVTTVTVIGASPAVTYPRQPTDSPANQLAMTPQEPSLGYDINAMEPTGEIHEQKASETIAGPKRRGWRRL
jgi:hypothetical protein